MLRLNVLTAALFTTVLVGCSSTHSPEFRDAQERVSKATEGDFDEKVKAITPGRGEIGRIHSGVAYHDVNDYSLIQRDDRKLPALFLQPITMLENGKPYTVDEFSALIYRSSGVILDVSSPDLRRLAAEMSGDVGNSSNVEAFAIPTPDEFAQSLGVAADSTGEFQVVNDLAKPVAKSDNRDTLKLKSFSFQGNMKEMLDYVALLNGLKWRYDPQSNKAYLYVKETREFFVHDFGSNRKIKSNIKTASKQESEAASGGSSMSHSRDLDVDTWKQITESVNGMIGDGGNMTGDQKTGMLLVTADDHTLSKVDRYIRALNDVTSKPITLQYRMVRVKYNETDFKGINQNYLNTQLKNGAFGNFTMEAGAGSLSANISGNKATMASLAQGNYLALANDSFQALMGFLNSVGTAELAYETQVIVPNNEVYTHQGGNNQEYISSIQRSNFREGGGQENITTETDVAVDGVNLMLHPRIAGDKVMVNYSVANSDFISLDDAGLGNGLEGVKLKRDSSLFFENAANLSNGQTEIVKIVSETEETTNTQGFMDHALWFLGGNENRQSDKSVIIMTLTAYYNN